MWIISSDFIQLHINGSIPVYVPVHAVAINLNRIQLFIDGNSKIGCKVQGRGRDITGRFLEKSEIRILVPRKKIGNRNTGYWSTDSFPDSDPDSDEQSQRARRSDADFFCKSESRVIGSV